MTTQYIWIGGDAYTAVAVAKKVGTGSWTVYNIFRDHLGTITHLKAGSAISEYSFDAWGRRRHKDTWSYTLDSEPALFADRGFTGHEYLEEFKLYNMNGRLYDPVVGRFLSPDPHIQDPSNTQNLNRYSYCLNNPLKYNDPSGELIMWPIAWFGNMAIQWLDNKINKKMSNSDAWKNTTKGVGFNYSPSANKFFNYQVDAQRTANLPDKIGTAAFNKARSEGQAASVGINNWWNTHLSAKIIPDVIYINVSFGVTAVKKGSAGSTGYALPLRGKRAFHLYGFSTYSNTKGAHLGVSDNVGYSVYVGKDARNFDFEQLFSGGSFGWQDDLILGISSSTSSGTDAFGGYLISNDIGFGIAVGGSTHKSNTTVWQIW